MPDFEAQFRDPKPKGAPYSVPEHPHLWLPFPAAGKGWRICKWCGLTQNPEEGSDAG